MPFTVLRTLEEWSARFGDEGRTVLSVGNFDGIHLGHQKILQAIVLRAAESAQRSAVITFDPHPLRLLRPEQAPRMIQTLAQRLDGFQQMGIDAVLVLHFDRALSLVSPEEFIERVLIDCLHVEAILVGSNFNFGYRGAGDVNLLEQFGKRKGFDVEIIPPFKIDGQVVSSTAIRTAIMEGHVSEAIPMLGRPFSLTGTVHAGAGRGRTILFPTLNLVPEQELLPKLGVYATECVLEGSVYQSVTNVGTRPTFNGQGITVESHLFGFAKEVGSGPLEVRFHMRIRDEQKFSGVDELRAQIQRDMATAQQYFSGVL
jgi:riboflavin kinase / FMN adenylyltransferase